MVDTEERLTRRRWGSFRDWALWKRPRQWIVFTLATETVTLALTITLFILVPVTSRDVVMLMILAALGLVFTETTRKLERMRRTLNVTPHINMTSVWLFPGALLLPLPLVAALVAIFYVHLGSRSWANVAHVAAHRTVTNATTATLSCFAAGLAMHAAIGGPVTSATSINDVTLGMFAALTAFFLINLVITVIALYLAAPEKASVQRLFGTFDDNALELTTLCLGALLLLALVHQPLLSLMIYFPMFVLQRSVLAKQLEELASKDQKTGLFNAVAWHNGGQRELSRVGRTGGQFSVLMIDLDFFKKINDSYGHLAGDDMLIALADLLKRETRAHDLVGRFGGEEFVVLLAGSTEVEAYAAAERIRKLITELVVHSQTNDGEPVMIVDRSASIGVAAYPAAGLTLDEVLASADAAVYAAKRGGRNQVVTSAQLDTLATTSG